MDIKKEAVNRKEVTLRLFHVVEGGDNGDSVDLDVQDDNDIIPPQSLLKKTIEEEDNYENVEKMFELLNRKKIRMEETKRKEEEERRKAEEERREAVKGRLVIHFIKIYLLIYIFKTFFTRYPRS